jgi:hypothetical protein
MFIFPEVEKRIEKGEIQESDLPFEIYRFRAIQKKLPDGNIQPIVELNQEVELIFQVTATKAVFEDDKYLSLNDIDEKECFIMSPIYDGKPASYFFAETTFCDYILTFDFRPNLPDVTEDQLQELKTRFPLPEFIKAKNLIPLISPVEKLKVLWNNNWPPSPGYFPGVLWELHRDPTVIDAPHFSQLISGVFDARYWERRVGFWQETDFFPNRISYIQRAVKAHFDKDPIASVYVLVPQFEGIVKDYLDKCGKTTQKGFIHYVETLKELIFSRKILLFPRKVLEIIFDYIETGSFWKRTSMISEPKTEINRHGILHGVFTGFECEEISLKYLILLDALSVVLLHDKILTRSI